MLSTSIRVPSKHHTPCSQFSLPFHQHFRVSEQTFGFFFGHSKLHTPLKRTGPKKITTQYEAIVRNITQVLGWWGVGIIYALNIPFFLYFCTLLITIGIAIMLLLVRQYLDMSPKCYGEAKNGRRGLSSPPNSMDKDPIRLFESTSHSEKMVASTKRVWAQPLIERKWVAAGDLQKARGWGCWKHRRKWLENLPKKPAPYRELYQRIFK